MSFDLKKQDIWCYDTQNGSNKKMVTTGQIQEALTGKQSDEINFTVSDLDDMDGKIYMMIGTEGTEDGSKPTCQLFSYMPASGSIAYEEGVFMSKAMIYHGSNVAVPNPKILINGYYKDFGYGFYCTNLEKQAKRWALSIVTFEGSETL